MKRRLLITLTVFSLLLSGLLWCALPTTKANTALVAPSSPLAPNVAARSSALMSGCATFTFSTATNFGVGTGPASVAQGDLNGDGKPDLVTANITSNNVSALLGNGDGTFGTATNFGVGTAPQSVALGDLNGDGKLDLVAANRLSNNVSALLGNGDGTFGTATNFGVGTGPQSVALGDLNGDGKLDLATANTNSHTVSVLLGNGDGTFGAATNFGVGENPYSLVMGDLNGDSKLDLVTANISSDDVSALLGNGDGTFGTATNFPVLAGGPRAVALGDLNGDGKLDLATANQNGDNLSVLLGNGDGTFGTATTLAVGVRPFSLAISDLNGDGASDLAVTIVGSATVAVLPGNGTGGFGAIISFSVGAGPVAIVVGDLNGDGAPDLATANQSVNTVSVLLRDCTANAAPTITANSVTRTAGNPGSSTVIAIVNDAEDAEDTLSVTAIPDAALGVTISISRVERFGHVVATVAAACHSINSTFILRVTDSGGLFAETTLTVNVLPDTIAPNTTLTSTPAAVSGANVSFSFSGTDNCPVSFECRLDSGGWTACTSPRSYSGLANGAHTFQVRAKDTAGNLDPTPASYTWQAFTASCGTTVNPATLPTFNLTVPYNQRLSVSPNGSYSFSLLAGTLPPGIQLDGKSGTLAGTPTTPGTYTFTIRAQRNNSTCVGARTYTVTVAPTVVPVLECLVRSGISVTATFGYDNTTGAVVTIPVGANNYFSPGTQNRGQTTVFQPGRVRNAFRVVFTGVNNAGTWNLRGPDGVMRSVTTTTATPSCP